MAKIFNPNAYNDEIENGVGKNSLVITSSDFVTKASGVVDKALATEDLRGISATKETFASDNQTVGLANVNYTPNDTNSKYELPVVWEVLTFAWDLITDNVINMNVNGVAISPVTFASDNATTLALIATELETFAEIEWATAVGWSDLVNITPATATNDGVVITDIVVTAGSTQTTGAMTESALAYTDEDDFYDITTGSQSLDYHTAHASSGQVQLYRSIESGTYGVVKIANT